MLAEGFLSGVHAGKYFGEGMEFSNYRSYEAGDDLRLLDWKLMARSDRMYVKQSESERNLSFRVVLDASASMQYEEAGIGKFYFARILAATLGYLAYKQGDAIGLHIHNNNGKLRQNLLPQHSSRQLERFFHLLENAHPSGAWTANRQLQNLIPAKAKREMVLIISDFYEKEDEISRIALHLGAQKHEVLLLHLMGKTEKRFHLNDLVAFEDLETGEIVEVLTDKKFGDAYETIMQERLEFMRKKFGAKKVDYYPIDFTASFEQSIALFLKKRQAAATSRW